MAKVIAVLGSTGTQGGGLCRAILADKSGGFSCRAITRDPSKDKAKELAAAGAEVVAGNLDDVESLKKAFAGAYGVYAVTNFWESFSGQKEKDQAKNVAEAAKAAGVQHVIWSTLEDTRRFVPLEDDRMPTLQDHYKVPHFDAKETANAAFTEAGVPTTFLYTSFYWENLIYFGLGPKRGEDEALAITYPLGESRLPGIAVADIGRVAYAVFKAGDDYVGKSVYISGENLTGAQMAAALSAALGEDVVYNDVDPDAYRDFGFPGADEVGNMFQFKRDFDSDYAGARDGATARALGLELTTFDDWLAENKERIPLD